MPRYVVRYGAMRFLGVFSTRGSEKYKRAGRVIARTNRGLEAGEVLCEATDEAVQYLKDPASGQIDPPSPRSKTGQTPGGNCRSWRELFEEWVSGDGRMRATS